jgi:hypothetical protein
MTADRFAMTFGHSVESSPEGAVTPAGNPSGFSRTFGLPYWQLQKTVNTPPADCFVRQTTQTPASTNSVSTAKTPLAVATETMQGHLKAWLQNNPDLLTALQDPAQSTVSDNQGSKKKKRRSSSATEISETDFSCRTSGGKEPAKPQVYSPYGDLSEGDESDSRDSLGEDAGFSESVSSLGSDHSASGEDVGFSDHSSSFASDHSALDSSSYVDSPSDFDGHSGDISDHTGIDAPEE